jgi:hypothetical protein
MVTFTGALMYRILHSAHGSVYSWEHMVQGTQKHIVQVTLRSLWFSIPFAKMVQGYSLGSGYF